MTSSASTLVIVDLQPVFQDPSSPWCTPEFNSVLSGIVALSEYFDSVLATRFVPPQTPQGSWIEYYQRWPEILGPKYEDHFGLVDEIAELGCDVVAQPTFSKWCEELERRVHGEITLVGVATECCVLATALAAVDAGCLVSVVTDLCRGSTLELHHSALSTLGSFAPQVRLLESAQFLGASGV